MATTNFMLRSLLAVLAGIALCLAACAGAGEDSGSLEDTSVSTSTPDTSQPTGGASLVDCPTLAELAGGYEGSASLDFGDDPGTCDWIDCEFGYGSWSGQLYIGGNGLFRMSQDFGAAWSGGSASATLHLEGVARVEGCQTLVVDRLYDYTPGEPGDLACAFNDYTEVTVDHDEIRLLLTLVSSGALEVRDPLDALGFGDKRVFKRTPSVRADNAHDNDSQFTSLPCDPTLEPCPLRNVGDPCVLDGDCAGGRCNGSFCTMSCSDEGEHDQCAGVCKYGENHVGKYNYCVANPEGGLNCMPECPWEGGRSLCDTVYPGSACLRIDGLELCRTSCEPNTLYCADGDRLIHCNAAGKPDQLDCDQVCKDLGYLGSKGCEYWPGGAQCQCVPAPCSDPWARECLGADAVRVCEDGSWQNYTCADDCENYGYGEPKGCWKSNGIEDCQCHPAPCDTEGMRDCIHDNLIRVCVDGLWQHMTCQQDCSQSGFGPPKYCGYRPAIGMDDCICELL